MASEHLQPRSTTSNMDEDTGVGNTSRGLDTSQTLNLMDLGSIGGDLGGSGGNFPFPLTDQTSLFNFHAPSNLGIDPLYSNFDQGLLGGLPQQSPTDASARFTGIVENQQQPQQLQPQQQQMGADDLAMDIALLDTVARTDPLAYATASSLMYGRGAPPGLGAASGFPPGLLPGEARQQQQQQQAMRAPGVPPQADASGQLAARVRAARARILNNVLYNMSLGGIQQLDGYYNSGIGSLTGIDDVASIASGSNMNRFLADVTDNSIGLPFANMGVGRAAAGGPLSVHSQDAQNTPTTSFAPPRIDQACKMCRRRKVRCDGLRPTCTFCQTKKFECVYEPVAPGGRKRGRRSKASDAGSVVSSNMDTVGRSRGQPMSSIRSTSGEGAARSMLGSVSDADDEHGDRRFGKMQRFNAQAVDLGDSPDGTDNESNDGMAVDDPEAGYLDALSNRQIALPDNVGPGFSLESILESRADLDLAEGVAAATLASLADDGRDGSSGDTADAQKKDGAAAAGAAAKSQSMPAPASQAEQCLKLYFTYFHPQHPILHRHTFEQAVRNGTVNKVLWQAVQAIAARYAAPPSTPAATAKSGEQASEAGQEDTEAKDKEVPKKRVKRAARPYEYGRKHAELVHAMLPKETRTPTIEVIQALYLISEHQFGTGDWLEGSTYWGTAVRMFNQLHLHLTDEAFQFPAYTSHLGLHESAISPLTCKQSPANYASEMRRPTLNNATWIKREMERRMRWALFEAERIHSLASGNPPLVTLEAGWVHMPCSDAIWEMPNPRRAAEYERLMLHMGRYYVDTGGSLRIDMAAASVSATSSRAASLLQSANESPESEDGAEDSDRARTTAKSTSEQTAVDAAVSVAVPPADASKPGAAMLSAETHVSRNTSQQESPAQSQSPPKTGSPYARWKANAAGTPNRVASMLVSVRRRKNRIHLNAHTSIVIGQMTRARLALFRLFFPCRWPSQLMASSGGVVGAGHDELDLGGGGGAPGPVVLSWEERFRRMRITISDIESKLVQWRVYLESMFPLREHEEGSGRSDDENQAIHRERIEYANYRFLLSALLIQNRSTVLQLQACLTRRERKIRTANQETGIDETAKRTLANHILPNQPDEAAMLSLRQYGQECWNIIVRQACEIEDLLESHWCVRPHSKPEMRMLIKPDWHAPNAIKAKINAETNLRMFPLEEATGQRAVAADVKVFFSHRLPPYPMLVINHPLIEAVIKSANASHEHAGAELTLASSMNSNIHIETNANARDMGNPTDNQDRKTRRKVSANGSSVRRGSTVGSAGRRQSRMAKTYTRVTSQSICYAESGEVDFESTDDNTDPDDAAMDPFRMQLASTPYFIFLAAKTMIMYLHHSKMSAFILARKKAGPSSTSETSDSFRRGSTASSDEFLQQQYDLQAEAMLLPEFMEDLSPPPALKTLGEIRRMQDRLEIVLTALRQSQKYWMSVDYFVLCSRKLRNMSNYGPWASEDPVSTDISAELANEPWPAHEGLSEDFSSSVVFST